MTLGEKIRIARQGKKMSQLDLAEEAGIYQKNISRYEKGTSTPSATAIKKIADALGVTTDYLLSDKEEVQIKDKELLSLFKQTEQLAEEKKQLIKEFLGSFLFKQDIHQKIAS